MSTGIGYDQDNQKDWNFYTTKVEDVDYNVYVVTYRSKLASKSETTTAALDKVYLDKSVDATQNEDGSFTYKDNKGNEIKLGAEDDIKILVFAEGCQTEGFADAYEALNKAFGTPGSTGYVSPFNK